MDGGVACAPNTLAPKTVTVLPVQTDWISSEWSDLCYPRDTGDLANKINKIRCVAHLRPGNAAAMVGWPAAIRIARSHHQGAVEAFHAATLVRVSSSKRSSAGRS